MPTEPARGRMSRGRLARYRKHTANDRVDNCISLLPHNAVINIGANIALEKDVCDTPNTVAHCFQNTKWAIVCFTRSLGSVGLCVKIADPDRPTHKAWKPQKNTSLLYDWIQSASTLPPCAYKFD